MGKVWSAELPVVSVAPDLEPKRITLVYPYYCNPRFLRRQVEGWWTWEAELRAFVTLIICDDGSPTSPAAEVLRGLSKPFETRVFRTSLDIRWAWDGARNRGLKEAADGWVLVTDIDHVVPVETMRGVIYGRHDPGVIYGFNRAEHTGEILAPHPNSWLLTREMFWKVGGYDERLSGFYGKDGDWRRRCAATAPMQILADRLIRHEYVDDASTSRYQRKQPEDAAVKHIVAARDRRGEAPKTLTFEYAEVSC